MAQLYFNNQLIATDTIHGVLNSSLVNEEIVITYNHKKNKYYTIIMYDDSNVNSMIINVKGDNFDTGDIIVDYNSFIVKPVNYDATIFIYEQLHKNKLPTDDFDMENYATIYKLTLLHIIEFTILQKLKLNYSNSNYIKKLKNIKNKSIKR